MKKIHFNITELKDRVYSLRENGIQRGKDVGFNCLRDHYTVKEGCTTYIVGAPYSGKSEFLYEILINLSQFYGWKHAIFSPESGNAEEIVAELVHKFTTKPLYRSEKFESVTDSELLNALYFLSEHFFIIDPQDKDLTIEEFYQTVDAVEKDNGVKINSTVGDPFNEFRHDFSKDEGRQDLYIERVLGFIRKNAKKTGRHNFVVTHCRDQQATTKDNVTYYPPPTARDYAGGQAWFRKGLAMLSVWRPPVGLNDANGVPYEENETIIFIQKSKPKGIGKNGNVKLFYDWKKGRYFEKYMGGNIYASNQLEQKTVLGPNLAFNNENDSDLPF